MTKLAKSLIVRPLFFRWCFGIAFATSLTLFVAGFLVPPMGKIDGSVLKAGGILLAFAVVAMLPDIIKSGRSAKIKHGDTTIEIDGHHGAAEMDALIDLQDNCCETAE